MIINRKSLCILICTISLSVCAQKAPVYLHTLSVYEDYYEENRDTTFVLIPKNIPELLIVYPSSEGDTNIQYEYFVLADTMYRAYILLDNKKYLIDSLCLKKYDDYAMNFQYTGTYCLSYNNHFYLIITGYNGYQYGTFVQPLFLVFQKKETEKEYHFLSSYYIENVEDNSDSIYNSVKVVYKKNKILLKGINLKCVHG